jgi:hypothetical protein
LRFAGKRLFEKCGGQNRQPEAANSPGGKYCEPACSRNAAKTQSTLKKYIVDELIKNIHL